MEFVNIDSVEVGGTSLQGYVNTTFAELVLVFGAPTYGPNEPSGDGKVTCEWCLEFSDDTVATIYDWKEGSTPMEKYSWHIGGLSIDSVNRVLEAM